MGERQKKREEVGGPFLRAVGVHREVQGGENHGHFCHTENEWRGARLYHLLLTLANLFKDHMMLLQQGQGICKRHPPHLARP